MTTIANESTGRAWPDFAAVRRWHFYAGLFCLPFFCWLAVTGSVYLFRPQIETWLDAPYESLPLAGPRPAPSAEARAAVAAVPGSTFSHYEPPATPTGAAQVVVVARDGLFQRVIVDPRTLAAMHVVQDDHRPMDVVAHLHGQLLMGQAGSMVVEVAGSWGVVMILTGLYLWWPRGSVRLGGLVYPRLDRRGRALWRDLHAVAGLWISVVTLFLLLSGLPWSSNWGNYLTWVRNHWTATQGRPDWPIGGMAPGAPRPTAAAGPDAQAQAQAQDSMPGMTAAEMAAMAPHRAPAPASGGDVLQPDLAALDRLPALAARLQLQRPVWISPPAPGVTDWTISSHAQNRPQRVTYTVEASRATVTGRQGFEDLNIVDRVVNVMIATHEGQLFGWLNQALLLANALAVLLLAASATVMWWRRRPANALGAPPPSARPGFSAGLVVTVAGMAIVLPLFGSTLLLVLLVDWTVLGRLPRARRWLGLAAGS